MDQSLDLIKNISNGFYYNLKFEGDLIRAKEGDLDESKQSVMRFLKVYHPMIEFIKCGFHKMADVLLDPMFSEHKKE